MQPVVFSSLQWLWLVVFHFLVDVSLLVIVRRQCPREVGSGTFYILILDWLCILFQNRNLIHFRVVESFLQKVNWFELRKMCRTSGVCWLNAVFFIVQRFAGLFQQLKLIACGARKFATTVRIFIHHWTAPCAYGTSLIPRDDSKASQEQRNQKTSFLWLRSLHKSQAHSTSFIKTDFILVCNNERISAHEFNWISV